ncbi:MAG: T9SS type A sorting domain-containing protein, partial [Bacteroidetes bacterium]|nr:T9SS type A sorting domain-containing protein [Bacteroidota bacterium]
FTGEVIFNSTITSASQQIGISPTLAHNTKYYWRVTAQSNLAKVTTSATNAFTTKLATPTLTSPADNATGVSLTPTLTWSSVTGADKYRLEVNTTSDFTGTFIFDVDTLTSTSKQITGLSSGTDYFWRVSAINSAGNFSDTSGYYYKFTTLTVTAVDNEAIIPQEYATEQNYPNPFNPTTTIRFALPEASFVTLKIYNMLGQEVKTLVNEQKNAGTFNVQWKGDNDSGNKVSSGTYIYRVIAGSHIFTKKMILLK